MNRGFNSLLKKKQNYVAMLVLNFVAIRQRYLDDYTCHLSNGLKSFPGVRFQIIQPIGPQIITKQARHKFDAIPNNGPGLSKMIPFRRSLNLCICD